MTLVPETQVETLAAEHKLKDVAWFDISPEWGILVGFTNGLSRYIEIPSPGPHRAPLKKKYRA